jgi:hypothetical protein
MPTTYHWTDAEMVLSTAESLKKAATQLTQVANDMQQNGMSKVLLPWSQRQFDCLDVIVTLAGQCVAVLPTQVMAKKQNRPSQYELMQTKSRRDVAARKARQAGAPPRPRGRPKKNPGK